MCGGALKVTQHYFKGLWEVLWHQSAFSFLFRNPIPSVLDLGLTSPTLEVAHMVFQGFILSVGQRGTRKWQVLLISLL